MLRNCTKDKILTAHSFSDDVLETLHQLLIIQFTLWCHTYIFRYIFQGENYICACSPKLGWNI